MAKITSIISKAPGRICLFGDHQDYLDLPIIACAIDRFIHVHARPINQKYFHVQYVDLDKEEKIYWDLPEVEFEEKHFLKTALKVLRRYKCIPTQGYTIQIKGDLPINAGLSSSSALTIAWIQFIWNQCNSEAINSGKLAELAFEAEVLENGFSGGKMDQFTISSGNLIYFDTKNEKVTHIEKKNLGLIVGVSGVVKNTQETLKHLKAKGLKSIQQVKLMHPNFEISKMKQNDLASFLPVLDPELRPIFTAAVNNYFITQAAKMEMDKLKWSPETLGHLMTEHHLLLKENLKITVPRIDKMINAALKAGAYGAKIVGSGGGGCIVALAPQNHEVKIIKAILESGAVDAFPVNQSKGPEYILN